MGTQELTVETTGDEALLALANRFIKVYASFQGAEGVFAPDTLFDVNVPLWRFQVRGPEAFLGWLKSFSPAGYELRLLRVTPTAVGFAAELEGTYQRSGQEVFFRNLLLCAVQGDRIRELLFFCTGDWDAPTRARQLREAPMLTR